MNMESRSRALDKIYKRRDRFEFPDWQREEVWTEDRQQTLIDTILKGWHLPKFYFVSLDGDEEQYEVVDGQQRLAAIWAFQDGNLALSDESASVFGGQRYEDLPPSISDKFDDFEIQFDEITAAGDEELTDLFRRLQLGVSLTPDERLNAVLGNLRDFCWNMARHSFFTEKVSFPQKRYAHFGVCVRFAHLEIEGVPNQLRLPQLESLLESHNGFSSTATAGKRMTAALDLLDSAFPEKSAALRNRSSVLALMRVAARLVESAVRVGRAVEVGRFFDEFMSNLRIEVEKGAGAKDLDLLNFHTSITSNLTSGSVIREREKILWRKLVLHSPGYAEALSPKTGGDGVVAEGIRSAGDRIGSLFHSINQAYAAGHGRDLFKATNQTVEALRSVARPVLDINGYGKLVDSLYFLVYESTGDGNRYGNTQPSFVTDIRALRTQLRHDVDHGTERKAGRKRQELGGVFRRYSGLNSPEVVPSGVFPAVHLKIVEECRCMLDQLEVDVASSGLMSGGVSNLD